MPVRVCVQFKMDLRGPYRGGATAASYCGHVGGKCVHVDVSIPICACLAVVL